MHCMQRLPLHALGASLLTPPLPSKPLPLIGGMFNIIRGVPLVGYDARKRQAMLFMAGQGALWGWRLSLRRRVRSLLLALRQLTMTWLHAC